jgi:hypothetical protein
MANSNRVLAHVSPKILRFSRIDEKSVPFN